MEFIQQRSVLFKKLVVNYFIRNYGLSITKFVHNLNIRNKKLIYVNGNYAIIHNKIINHHYNIKLDETKYSLMIILYKNIKYKQLETNSAGKQNMAFLNSDAKRNIYKIFRSLNHKHLISDAMIIGRKYKNDNKIIQNSLGLYCIFDILKMKHLELNNETENKIVEKKTHNTSCQFVATKTILRRQFLLNLKKYINQNDIKINTLYTHNIIKNSIFLDVEYTNDIYDDFSTFPISKDTSLLFIIGISRVVNNESHYTDFTSRRLTWQEEYRILNDFLDYIQNDKQILIFHWSHADKYIIEKSLARYPDLQE